MSAEIIDNYSNILTDEVEDIIDLDSETNSLDSVRMYLNSIGKIPLLKAADEQELAKDIEAGLYAEELLAGDSGEYSDERENLEILAKLGRVAYDRMVSANLRLVVSMARKYQASGVPLLDLVQEGNMALMYAVKKFDYKRGYKLSTAVSSWIRKSIITSTYQQSARIPVSVKEAEKLNVIRKNQARLLEELEREPTDDELASATNIPADVVRELLIANSFPVSVDQPIGDDTNGGTIAEYIYEKSGLSAYNPYDERDVQVNEEARLHVDSLLQGLQERDERIIRDLFGLNGDGKTKTRDELARELEIDSCYLKQKCDKIVARLGASAHFASQ